MEKGQHDALVLQVQESCCGCLNCYQWGGDLPAGSGDRNWCFGSHKASGFGCVSHTAGVLSGKKICYGREARAK